MTTQLPVQVAYAPADEAVAIRIADALSAEGYAVTRDPNAGAQLGHGQPIVLALWSPAALDDGEVRAAAQNAHGAGRLVSAIIEDCAPPFGLSTLHSAHLVEWFDDRSDIRFKQLTRALAEVAQGETAVGETQSAPRAAADEGASSGETPPPQPAAPQPADVPARDAQTSPFMLALPIAMVVVLLLILAIFGLPEASPPTPAS